MDAAAHLMLWGEVWRRRSGYFKPGFSVCCGKDIPMWPKKKKKRLEESWRRLKLRKAEAHSIVWARINAWKPVRTMLKTDYLHSWGFGRETVLLYSSLGLGRLQSFRRSGTGRNICRAHVKCLQLRKPNTFSGCLWTVIKHSYQYLV